MPTNLDSIEPYHVVSREFWQTLVEDYNLEDTSWIDLSLEFFKLNFNKNWETAINSLKDYIKENQTNIVL